MAVIVNWTDPAALVAQIQRLERLACELKTQLHDERQRTAAVERETEALRTPES